MAQGPAEIAHGYMLTGFMLNVLLFGIMITQVYIYYTTYKKDRLWIKCFVAFLFFADFVNTGLCYAYLYRAIIVFFGDLDRLFVADWIFATEPATTAIIASTVQLFFAWRVRVLTKSWALSWFLVFLVVSTSLTSGIAGIMTGYEVGRTPHFTEFQKFKGTVSTWLGSTCACDVFITSILRKHKTGFQRSDLIIDRIIRITVQTGLITMIVAALDLAFYLTDPGGLHLLFSYPLSKLYTNSLMSTLNARHSALFGQITNNNSGGDSEAQINTTSGLKPSASALSYRNASTKPSDMINLGVASRPEVFVHVEQHELREVAKDSSDSKVADEKGSLTPRSSIDGKRYQARGAWAT